MFRLFSTAIMPRHHRHRLCCLAALLLFGMLWCDNHLHAQQPRGGDPKRSSRGKDFRLAFLPNYHDLIGAIQNRPFINDSLYIFITCDKPTSGVITYRTISGQRVTRPFQITNPAQFFIFSAWFSGIELEGFNNGSRGNPNSQNERIAPQSFRVTAEDEVTVYGLDQARYTSDAFLVLPVPSLSLDYRVLSYDSDASGSPSALSNPGSSTPSQFCVVATADNTQVRITPNAPTIQNPTQTTVTVTLNEGDVYLVQADPRLQAGRGDLTGSRVQANKPVAVFGGHQRSKIPIQFSNNLNSRDCLIEQMPGVETWGKQSFITPYTPSNSQTQIGTDLYRVLAGYDSTVVFVNGQRVATLNAGQFYEAPIVDPAVITASDQILVGQYKKTSNTSGDMTSNTGDPFLMVIPTVEQYDTTYRFINVQSPDNGVSSGQIFSEHFVTVVIPTRFAASVRIDERSVNAQAFRPIQNSGYAYANFSLDAGVHTARADTAFGLYVYGYGQANSYGYIAGGKLRIISPDRDKPLITASVNCFEARGAAFDTLVTDSRIAAVEYRPTTLANVSVDIDPFSPFADSVRFAARLQNVYQDGSFIIRARDSIGFVQERVVPVYGFTIGAELRSTTQNVTTILSQGTNSPPIQQQVTITTGRSRAFPVTIVNYGATTQTITALRLAQNTAGFFLREQLPIVLAPSSRATVNIRFEATRDGVFTDTLIVVSTCATRAVTVMTVAAGADRTPPTYAAVTDECARTVTLRFSDAEGFASGIVSLQALQQINCTVQFENITNASIVGGLVRILDPKQDAFYSLRVQDSSGNVLTVRDTIPGLTLVVVPQRVSENMPDTAGVFGPQTITLLTCQTLVYRNLSVKPFVLNNLAPLGNRYFSVPQNQLPIVIPAKGEVAVKVCFAPLENRSYRDTIKIERFCTEQLLILTGSGIPLTRTEESRCKVDIRLTTAAAPREYYTEQNFPNPTSGLTTIVLGLPEPAQATVKLYTSLGSAAATLADVMLPAGLTELQVDVSNLESGVYWYEVQYKGANSFQRSIHRLTVTR